MVIPDSPHASGPPVPPSPARDLRPRLLALIGLVALGLTQPTLDAVFRNDLYRRAADLGWGEYLALCGLFTVVVTPLLLALDRLVWWAAGTWGGRGRNSVLFVLTVVAVLACLRPLVGMPTLRETQLSWLFSVGIAIPAAGLVATCFERSKPLQQWLSVVAAGAVVFPGAFVLELYRPAVAAAATAEPPQIRAPRHVVMVVFDEFSGVTLMDESLHIDRDRFPGFARLAEHATWYRQATSSHARTDQAVPAILSSRIEPFGTSPVAKNYPANLFEVLDRTDRYRMTVFEPVTQLFAKPNHEALPTTGFVARMAELLTTMAAIYPRLILPLDAPIAFPQTPLLWHGIVAERAAIETVQEGRISYSWGSERDQQLHHFLGTIRSDDTPHLWFFHCGLPHFPWCYTASGRRYLDDANVVWPPPAGVGDIGEEWPKDDALTLRCEFRYRQQVGYIDRFVNDLQDRLQEQGVWDDCLLIVMADHGVSFRPGSSRRYPDSINVSDLMNVPLFIKYPSQTHGQTDDRNVESIDVLPTIADVLGMEADPRWEGASVLSAPPRLRKRFDYEDGTIAAGATVPKQQEAVQRQARAFGRLPLSELPATAMSHPEWRGLAANRWPSEPRECSTLALITGTPPSIATRTKDYCPCLVQGQIHRVDVLDGETEIVAAVDGVVVDSCRLYDLNYYEYGFHLFVPEDRAPQSGGQLELFLIPAEASSTWQRVYQGPL